MKKHYQCLMNEKALTTLEEKIEMINTLNEVCFTKADFYACAASAQGF